MPPEVYHLLHLICLFLLVGCIYSACANPKPESRKKVLAFSGILSLVVLVSGFGLITKLNIGFPGWIIVKVICWLGLSALAGVAYRKPEKASLWIAIASVLIAVAVAMVYLRPF